MRYRSSFFGVFCLLATVVAVALSAPQAASAKPGYFVLPAERSSRLHVRATQGFQIAITRTGRRVELTASKGSVSANYVVRAEKGPVDGIEATFPGVGRVSLHFYPSGRAQRVPGLCRHGNVWLRQDGRFNGMVKFEGERGYTRLSLRSTRGFVIRRPKEACRFGKGGRGKNRPTNFPFYSFAESGRSRGRTTAFGALRSVDEVGFDSLAMYFAVQQVKRHGMTTVRSALAIAGPKTLAIAGPAGRPESVTFKPPSPFSGTASFHAPPGAPAEWEGTLAVELPGAGAVPLTGAQFKPVLCRGVSCLNRASTTTPTPGAASPIVGHLRHPTKRSLSPRLNIRLSSGRK